MRKIFAFNVSIYKSQGENRLVIYNPFKHKCLNFFGTVKNGV